jgi:hypothetical protein
MTKTSSTVVACAALPIVLAAAFFYGRDARVRIEQAEAQTRAQEVSAFCREAGFAPGSAAYARCAAGLEALTARDRARWEADAAGIL